ncbi:MAG: rhomboid family intramembrane serine protease [Hyphomicrobium sp.]
MFFPLHDENPLRSIRFQYMTIALIVANVLVYLLEVTGMEEAVIASFAVVPSELLETAGSGGQSFDAVPVPEPYTLLTYMFFHGDVIHLAGNMLFLWVFGDNVEDAVGHVKFLVFYLLCGVFAGLVHAAISSGSQSPLIGASGAVAGVIAAYLMLHPKVMVWGVAFKVFPLRITAAFALGLWIVTQIVMVLLPQVGPVAWWAHIGGLIAGAVLIVFMRRRGVPLFDGRFAKWV